MVPCKKTALSFERQERLLGLSDGEYGYAKIRRGLVKLFQTISSQARGEMLRSNVPLQNTDQIAVVSGRPEAEAVTTIVEIAVGSWHTKPTRVTTRRTIKMDLESALSETTMEQRTLHAKKARSMLWKPSRLKWKHWRRP